MTSLVFGDGLALRPSGLIGSILGATLYQLMQSMGVPRGAAAGAGMLLVAGSRLAAIVFNWTLPVFGLPGNEDR